MSDSFELKLAVWERIQKGIASANDHALAMQWGEEQQKQSISNSSDCDKWVVKNGEACLKCWSDDGFLPSGVGFSSDLLLIFASCYSVSDIENGGLLQFFQNWTGCLAPEALLGFRSMGCESSALNLELAMSLFGFRYPRSQQLRTLQIADAKVIDNLNLLTEQIFVSFDKFSQSADPYFRRVMENEKRDSSH